MDNDRGATRHSKGERVQFKRLPAVLRTGDVLVLWEPSRITRDPVEFGPFCDMLAERDVPLYYNGRLYDMRDDEDRNQVWQDILDGAKAASKTRKRVLRAMGSNVKKGLPHGPTPPGYRILRDARTGRSLGREVHPDQQRLLKIAADRVLVFDKNEAIARDLSDAWVKSGGKPLTGRDIKRFLVSPTTYGLRVHAGAVTGKGTWDPCLDPELMPTLRKILLNPDRLTRTGGSEPCHLLTFGRCSVCKGPMGWRPANQKERKSDRYTCRNGHLTRNAQRADEFVEELFLELMEKPETLALLNAPVAGGETTVEEQLAFIADTQQEIDRYLKEAAKTRMSATAQAVYVEELEAEIRKADATVKALSTVVDPALLTLAGPGGRAEWADWGIPEQRRVMRSVLQVWFVPVGRFGRGKGPVGVEVYPVGVLAMR